MYKNIALPAPKPSSWNIFSWITCGSSADVIPPSTAPTELEKIAIQINMTTFVRENYHAVLSEARCPCSGEAMPCPSAVRAFEAALETSPLNLKELKICLFGLQRERKRREWHAERDQVLPVQPDQQQRHRRAAPVHLEACELGLLVGEGRQLGAVMQERGLLLFRVGLDLVQLDHRRGNRLKVRDATLLGVLLPEGL